MITATVNEGQTNRILAALETQTQTMALTEREAVTEILEYLSEMAIEDLAAQFQILWDTGANPGSLSLGATVPSAAILKAELDQPGISRARQFMLEKIHQGQAAAEQAWALDQKEQGRTSAQQATLTPKPLTAPASKRPLTEQVEFLESLLAAFHQRWRTNPLFKGAVNEIVQSQPAYLMALAQDPEQPSRLQLAPLIILLALTEGAMNHWQQRMEQAIRQRQMPDWNRLSVTRRAQANRQIEMEAVEVISPMIGSALRSSRPLTSLIQLNDTLATLNLKAAGLSSA